MGGPAAGGELFAWRGTAPFAAAALLGCVGFVYQVLFMPEYLPASCRNTCPKKKAASVTSLPLDFLKLLRSQRSLIWYVAAAALYSLGSTSYSAVQPLWVKEAFNWDGRMIGRYSSVLGVTLMFSQLTLKQFLGMLGGNETVLAQGALIVNAVKLVAYSLAPNGYWVFALLVACTPGLGCVSILRSLCTKAVPESQQGLLGGALAALSTSVSVLGALIGSKLLANAQEQGGFLGTFLLFSASSFVLATACLTKAARIDAIEPSADGEPALVNVSEYKRQMTP